MGETSWTSKNQLGRHYTAPDDGVPKKARSRRKDRNAKCYFSLQSSAVRRSPRITRCITRTTCTVGQNVQVKVPVANSLSYLVLPRSRSQLGHDKSRTASVGVEPSITVISTITQACCHAVENASMLMPLAPFSWPASSNHLTT